MENGEDCSITNFIPLEKIGEGSFSSVYKVRRKADERVYALKKIKIASMKEKQKKNALNQIRILASVFSPYIVQYREAFFDQNLNLLCIVMELANNGDLQKKIQSCRSNYSRFPEPEIWKMVYQTVKGLEALHSRFIMHRDIKSANIFISNGVYKLGDLNVSKIFNVQDILAKTQTGTPYYASPEVWRDEPYDSKSDIWSLGCVIYEMCALKPPFKGKDLEDLYQKVQKGKFEDIPIIYSKELNNLIRMCLKKKSYDRPTCTELLQNILIKKCREYNIDILQDEKDRDLLKTIKLPSNLRELTLPKSAYEMDEDVEDNSTITQQKNILKSRDKQKDRRQSHIMRKKVTEEQQACSFKLRELKQNPQSIKSDRCRQFFQQKGSTEKLEQIKEQIAPKKSSRNPQSNYISEDSIRQLQKIIGPPTKPANPDILRKLSQDEKNVSSQKRRKNILGEINLLRKLSENNSNIRKQHSQRYINIHSNPLKNILRKVGSTDRMYIRNSKSTHKSNNISKHKCISKLQDNQNNYQQLRQCIKKPANAFQNKQKQLKKISSSCRMKNQLLCLGKHKNISYKKSSDVLQQNMKQSANQISLILEQKQNYENSAQIHENLQGGKSYERIMSPRQQQYKNIGQTSNKKLNKISSTPYLSAISNSKHKKSHKNISSCNTDNVDEFKIKKKNRYEHYQYKMANLNKLHLF